MKTRIPLRAAMAAGILATGSTAQDDSISKRGVPYTGGSDEDYSIFLSSESPINWYFTWSPVPAPFSSNDEAQSRLEFVPALPGLDNLDNNIAALNRLPESSRHLFTFNEPDGSTDSGGSDISPDDAARAYIDKIVPLRDRFRISHPSVTGSPRGLAWLDDFNSSCWDIDPEAGCPADFVTAHWYGEFAGLTSWLDQMAEWYNQSGSGMEDGQLKIWVKEFGLPQADADATLEMMNQSIQYMDALPYVEKYAWFGAFRPKAANAWTGDGVALFEGDGGLSKLGAFYLGGEENGFEAGQHGDSSDVGGGSNGGNDNNNNDDDSQGDDNTEDGNADGATGLRTSLLTISMMVMATAIWNL